MDIEQADNLKRVASHLRCAAKRLDEHIDAIIANPDEAPDVNLSATLAVTHEIDGSLHRHNDHIPAYEVTSPFTSDKNPEPVMRDMTWALEHPMHDEPVTPPPDEVVEALRDEGMLLVKHYADLAAAVRNMSWALEHSANDCDTAEELERYIPICKTAERVVQEMNG